MRLLTVLGGFRLRYTALKIKMRILVEMEKREELQAALGRLLNEKLERMIFSNPRSREHFIKLSVRPISLRGALYFQIEEFTEKQAFQKNLLKEEALSYLLGQLESLYRNAEAAAAEQSLIILISKKGTVTIKEKRRSVQGKKQTEAVKLSAAPAVLPLHNRTKKYLLPEGTPVPFLVDLGVMTADGRVVKARYDKFRQINRFLEFIEDILPRLDKGNVNTIIDFGCGKSYLTFAMYYYLKEIKGYPIRVIGLDLKKDVIALCSRLAQKFGFTELQFLHGDIAGFEGVQRVDMVVTLHACDTATDYAMAKAVRWGAKVILSVPCCQHELNKQIQHDLLAPVLQYGLLRERMSALLTDGIRAQLLEAVGYRTQVLEFIDMEHTPKNIMVRAVYQGTKKDSAEVRELISALHAEPTLYQLFREEGLIE